MSGIKHWKWQRYSAILLIPLSIWLFTQLLCLPDHQASTLTTWLVTPINAGLLFLTMVIAFRHGMLGIEVIAEDYISNDCTRNAVLKSCAIVLFSTLGLLALSLILTITGA